MEDTVIISIKEYETLLAEREELLALRRKFDEVVANLGEELDWCKRQIFGRTSERFVDAGTDAPLLPWAESLPTPAEPEKLTVPAYERRKTPKEKEGCPLELPDDMPVEIEVVDIPEDEKVDPITGEAYRVISHEDVIKLAYRQQYVKKIFRYLKYSLPKRPDLGVQQAPAPPCVIKGSRFDVSFMAYLAYAKYALHLPLNRIQEDLANHGIKVSRQTLSQLLVALGQSVIPVWEVMIAFLLKQGIVFTDDTPLDLLTPGAGKTHQAQIWTYVGGGAHAPPYHVYEFTMNRSQKHPLRFLQDFVGFVHGDAFEAHLKLDQRDDVYWSACWAHARRKFENAQSGDAEFRDWVLRHMRYLFMFERIAWKRDPMARLAIRQQHERPIVDKLFAVVNAKLLSGELLPQSSLAKAVNYLLRYKQNFRNYLYYPDLRMDNNISERSLRKLVLGRKNWLFVGSERAGRAAAAMLSLVQTCRAMNINVQTYLEDLFTHLPEAKDNDLQTWLPDRWLARQPHAD